MAFTGLLALIDDIAAVLDDVAVLSKVAAKQTAGVLGDDLALNAEQVAGVRAERELPVVWAVAKGSLMNKVIIVPVALAISAFVPWMMTLLLMVGGAFLCYEGFEKLVHKFTADKDDFLLGSDEQTQVLLNPDVDPVALEREKIKGAIRTDFILSAEIVVISMGAVKDAVFSLQVAIVAGLALGITIGVYGLVAAIVKLDDVGLHLLNSADTDDRGRLKRGFGRGLLLFAPYLMKSLSVVGTAAMFLVGGGILVHGLPHSHEAVVFCSGAMAKLPAIGCWLAAIMPYLLNAVVGVVVGGIVLAGVAVVGGLLGRRQGAV